MAKNITAEVLTVYELFISEFKLDSRRYISLGEICDAIGYDVELSKDEKVARYIVKRVRDMLYEQNYLVTNKVRVGWKISDGAEALDEVEKGCWRMVSMAVGAKKEYLNRNLPFSEIIDDPERHTQAKAINEFFKVLYSISTELGEAIGKSPFKKKNIEQVNKAKEPFIGKDTLDAH
jgi:hypothetical protein